MNDKQQSPKNPICDELRDLIPIYGMGMADDDEIALIEAHINECPDLQVELADYQQMQDAMLIGVSQIQPPASIKAGLMDAVQPQQRVTPKEPIPLPVAPRPSWMPRLAWGLVASIVLLLITNLYWVNQTSTLRGDLNTLQTENTSLQLDNTILQSENADLIAQLDAPIDNPQLIASGTTSQVDLAHNSINNAELSWVESDDGESWIGWLVSVDLPPLDTEDTVYQGWLMRADDAPLSIGVFEVSAENAGAFIFEIGEPIGTFELVGITVEPAGGSDAPTSDPIALGEI